MFIPINTDAPLYHFPWMTIVLIVVNSFCFLATGFGLNEARLDTWLLEYGNGLNPLEWIPAAFAHAGFVHLLGNMFFLWGFGLVVEGKLGWWRFLLLYLGLAAVWGLGVDVLTLHRTDAYVLRNELQVESLDELADKLTAEWKAEFPEMEVEPDLARRAAEATLEAARGRCLGASGVLFGLMAMALVWAPKNELHIVGFIAYRFFSFDVTILGYAAFYLVLNAVLVLGSGFRMGSSGLHLVGAVAGFIAGVVYLKRGWVECENWDLFAVMSGTHGRFGEKDWALGAHGIPDNPYGDIPVPEGMPDDARPPHATGQSDAGLTHVADAIDRGDFLAAAEDLLEVRLTNSAAQLDRDRLKTLAIGLLKAQAFDEAEVCLEEYIERCPDDDAWARVRMAQVLLTIRRQPHAARQMLKRVDRQQLTPSLLAAAKKASATARRQIADGVQDAQTEW